jgi:flagellar biosynthesis chaperone FliJ
MARFVWRLLKVYEMYQRRKQAQEQRVQEAEARYRAAVADVANQQQTIVKLKQDMKTAHYTYFEIYDRYLEVAHQELVRLEQVRDMRLEEITEEKRKLREIQQDIDALEKHREKSREVWLEEEKAIEMKQLDEIGAQRYFRQMAEVLEEQAQQAEALGISVDDLETYLSDHPAED